MFTLNTLSFPKSLKRNNQREWFHARKDAFDTHCRTPMIEVVERLAVELRSVAPEMVADPKVSLWPRAHRRGLQAIRCAGQGTGVQEDWRTEG
jgi:uncharacterized protein (DUF2461 family)